MGADGFLYLFQRTAYAMVTDILFRTHREQLPRPFGCSGARRTLFENAPVSRIVIGIFYSGVGLLVIQWVLKIQGIEALVFA